MMFFVPYVLFQPPMTIIIRKVGPTLFLGTIVITWAVIMIVRTVIIHWTPVANISIGYRIRQELGTASRPTRSPRCPGSRLFPRLRLPALLLVHSV